MLVNFFWKQCRIVRRKLLFSIFIVITPAAIFCLSNHFVNPCYQRNFCDKIVVEQKIFDADTIISIETYSTQLFYTPSNNVTDYLVDMILEHLGMPSSNIHIFPNKTELQRSFSISTYDSVVAIIFNKYDQDLDYTIQHYRDGFIWNTDQLFGIDVFPDEESQYSVYNSMGLMHLQYAIELSYIQYKTQSEELLHNQVYIKEIPHLKHAIKKNNIRATFLEYTTLFVSCVATFLFILQINRDKKLRALEKLSGFSDSLYSICWFLIGAFNITITVVLIVIYLLFGNTPFIYTPIYLIAIFLFLHFVSDILYSIIISHFQGNYILWVLLLNGFHIILTVIIKIIDKNINSFLIHLLCAIFPSLTVHYGYNIIFNWEMQEINVRWDNIFENPTGSSNRLTLGYILLAAVINIYISIFCSILYTTWHSRRIRLQVLCLPKATTKNSLLHNKDYILNVEGLSKIYGEDYVVNNVTCDFKKNRITVLLGHNGAGKTTLMNMINGIVQPTYGTIYFNGINREEKQYRKIALCPQHDILDYNLTVKEHLTYFGRLKSIPEDALEEQTTELLQRLALLEKINIFPSKLSGGMKRKLCLAIALITNPEILILDEPTAGIDAQSCQEIWNILKEERKTKTILISTHYMDEADALADMVLIMNKGQILHYDTPNNLKKRYKLGYRLFFEVDANCSKEKFIMNIVQYMKDHKLEGEYVGSKKDNLEFSLDSPDKNYLVSFLKFIEMNLPSTGMLDFSLTTNTLQDVFLKSLNDSSCKIQVNTETKIPNEVFEEVSLAKRIRILFEYRVKTVKSIWKFSLTSIVVVIILLGIVTAIVFKTPTNFYRPPIRLSFDTYKNINIYYSGHENLFENHERIHHLNTENLDSEILDRHQDARDTYVRSPVLGAKVDESEGFTILHHTNAYHSAPIVLNTIMNAYAMKFFNGTITLTNEPFNRENFGKETKVIDEEDFLFYWTLAFFIGNIILTTKFMLVPFIELHSKFLLILNLCGVRLWEYWIVTLIMDFLVYTVETIIIIIVQKIMFYHLELTSIDIDYFGLYFYLTGIASFSVNYILCNFYHKTLSVVMSIYFAFVLFLGFVPIIFNYLDVICGGIDIYKNYLPLLTWFDPYIHNGTQKFFNNMINKYNWNVRTEEETFKECLSYPDHICCNSSKDECSEHYNKNMSPNITIILKNLFIWVIFFNFKIFKKIIYVGSISYFKYILGKPATQINIKNGRLSSIINVARKINIKSIKKIKNECLCILGLNGAGKSTMFKTISGEILNDDVNSENNDNVSVGYCPQHNYLNPILTGRESLTVIGKLRGITNIKNSVDFYIECFGLNKFADKKCKTYSGGYKRILSYLIALIGTKDLNIFDEPTNGVDPHNRKLFWTNLKNMQQQKEMSVLISTQSMLEAEELSDRVMIIKEGIIKNLNSLLPKSNVIYVKIDLHNPYECCGVQKLKGELSQLDNSKLIDESPTTLQYSFEPQNRRIRYSYIFDSLNRLRSQHSIIADFNVSESAIQDMFSSEMQEKKEVQKLNQYKL